MSGSSRLLNISIRVYGTLLKVYPASFRREYGEEMTILFREMGEDALQRSGTIGLVRLWCRLLVDVTFTAIGQHLRETRRRIAAMRIVFSPAYRVLALAVALLIGALVTPADPLSMLIVGLPLYLAYLGACRVMWRPKGAHANEVSNVE